MSQSLLNQSKTLIVKVGSSLVTNNGEGLDRAAIADWAAQISALVKTGKQVVLVTRLEPTLTIKVLDWVNNDWLMLILVLI